MGAIVIEKANQWVNVGQSEGERRVRIAEGPDEVDDVATETQADGRRGVGEVQFEEIGQILQVAIQWAVETIGQNTIEQREKRVQIQTVDFRGGGGTSDRHHFQGIGWTRSGRAFTRLDLFADVRLRVVTGHEQAFEIVDHRVHRALVHQLFGALNEFQPQPSEQAVLDLPLKPLRFHLLGQGHLSAGVVQQGEEMMPETSGHQRGTKVELQEMIQGVNGHEEQRFQIQVDRRLTGMARVGRWIAHHLLQVDVLRVIGQGDDQIRGEKVFDLIQRLVGDRRGLLQILPQHTLIDLVQQIRGVAGEERVAVRALRRRQSVFHSQLIVHRMVVAQTEMLVQQRLDFERLIDGEEIEDELNVAIETVVDGEGNDLVVAGKHG